MPDVPPRALILDYGQVLSHPQRPEVIPRMAQLLGVGAEEMARAYWAHRAAYDLDLPVGAYWRAVATDVGAGVPDDALCRQLIDLDIWSWTDYRESVWSLAQAFRASGGRTAILSNGVPEITARLREERRLEERFDAVVVSCEVGCSKPQAAIYELTLARLGARPAETLFVDDREENVAAARALGLQALLFAGPDAEAALRSAVAG